MVSPRKRGRPGGQTASKDATQAKRRSRLVFICLIWFVNITLIIDELLFCTWKMKIELNVDFFYVFEICMVIVWIWNYYQNNPWIDFFMNKLATIG